MKGLADWVADSARAAKAEESELGGGNLIATGLVAGGALTGVVVALLQVNEGVGAVPLHSSNMEPAIASAIGHGGYTLLGVAAFVGLGVLLFRAGMKSEAKVD